MYTGRLNRLYYFPTSQGCILAFKQFKFVRIYAWQCTPESEKGLVTFTCHCYTRLDVKRAAEPAQKENKRDKGTVLR